MRKNIAKISFLVVLNVAIIGSVNKAEAFPLPTLDISRITTAVQNTMHAVQEIKQEIESNLRIIQEIQNGGFMAAAGDLFGKIQNGDYDRFGQNLKAIRSNTKDISDKFGSAKFQNEQMKQYQAEGLSRAAAKEKAAQDAAAAKEVMEQERAKQAYEKAKDKAVEFKAKELMREDKELSYEVAKQQAEEYYKDMTLEQIILENQTHSKFNNVYSWLKESRGVTDAGFDAIRAGSNGDWSQALVSAGAGVGSGFAISGDQNFGAFVSAGAGLVGGVVDAAGSGSINEAYSNLKYNYGGIIDNAADMGTAYQNYDDERWAAKDSAEGRGTDSNE